MSDLSYLPEQSNTADLLRKSLDELSRKPMPLMVGSPQAQIIPAQMNLTDAEHKAIRQIIAEEVSKVFPRLPKPDIGIPMCPDCGQWVLSEHDWAIPLNNGYRSWWCTCPEKVVAWERQGQERLDTLLEAIHESGSEIEAVLVELSEAEFESLIAKVRASKKMPLDREKRYGVIEVPDFALWDLGISWQDLTTQGELQAHGVFDKIRERILLPQDYTIHAINLPSLRRPQSVEILVEHPDIPLPKAGCDLPQVRLVYQPNEGTKTLLCIEVEE